MTFDPFTPFVSPGLFLQTARGSNIGCLAKLALGDGRAATMDGIAARLVGETQK